MPTHDLVIKGGNLVIPRTGVIKADIGVAGGKIAEIAQDISVSKSNQVIDAKGKFVFPGAIDSHFHVGIYRPMGEDALSESASAACGGVTTILSFFRTGQNYLNKIGPYRDIYPEVLEISRNSFVTDYSYHLAIMTQTQLSEIEWLVNTAGVSQFKFYMFYKKIDLAGASKGSRYLLLDEPLDLGFLYELMSEVSRVNRKLGNLGTVRVAVHCEDPEIITSTTKKIQASGGSGNLSKDYSDSRPTWAERLAIHEVGVIAANTGCPINLVHLTSQQAVDAADEVSHLYPELDIFTEATLHHLSLSYDKDFGVLGKVNPPIRSREDMEYVWRAVLDGRIQAIVSDHACATRELKKGDIWTALPGFGGTSLMFPVLITEGFYKRNLPLEKIAELTSYNPAKGHNLYPKKGTIMIGTDADFALVDLQKEQVVTRELLHSAQDFSPFEGVPLKGWPVSTILRGQVIYRDGELMVKPGYGEYLKCIGRNE